MLDGLPISLDHNRVPLRLAPELAELDFTHAPRCTRRSTAPATRPRRADYELEARGADAPEAELLGLAPGAPVLFATTVAIGEDGRVVDLGPTVYRADRYRFQATLMRRAHRGRGRPAMRRRIARARCRSRWRSPIAGCGGTPGAEKPNDQAQQAGRGGQDQTGSRISAPSR